MEAFQSPTASLSAELKSFVLNHHQCTPEVLLPHRSYVWIRSETSQVFKSKNFYCYFYWFNSNPIISDSNPHFLSKYQATFLYEYREEKKKNPN